MTAFALSLLPHLIEWGPLALGGGGGFLFAMAGCFPKLRTYAIWALVILLVLSIGGLLWFRAELATEKAKFATYQAEAASKAVKEKTNATQGRAVIDRAVRDIPDDDLDRRLR